MPRGRKSAASLSESFHDVMLAVEAAAGTAPSPPSTPQGPSPSRYGPSISQGTYTPQYSPLKAKSRHSTPLRSSFRSPENGAYTELQEKYSLLQRGFITLEGKYQRRREELVKLKEELRVQAEREALHTSELRHKLEINEAELRRTRDEFGNVAHATRAVKDIVNQVMGELSTQLKCPICSNLLRIPHSLCCSHVACCVCIIDSFQHHGVKCPICGQPCTQPPRQEAVIVGILSVTYKLFKSEEPTFTSIGLDPSVFLKFFQTAEQLSDNMQQIVQHQFNATEGIGSTQGQDEPDPRGGDVVVSGHVHQPVHHGEAGVGGVAGMEMAVGDVGPIGQFQVVGPTGTSIGTEDAMVE